jgi:hypothetical protein
VKSITCKLSKITTLKRYLFNKNEFIIIGARTFAAEHSKEELPHFGFPYWLMWKGGEGGQEIFSYFQKSERLVHTTRT